jgi:hypothetical protein
MPLSDIVHYAAPAATMIAATVTEANFGAKATGWGFVVFTFGSICWVIMGVTTGQTSLLLANLYVTAVNAVGIHCWLWRQAAYDDSSKRAEKSSSKLSMPDLISIKGLIGKTVCEKHDQIVGTIVDAMARCASLDVSYVIVSEGGLAGMGEKLHAIDSGQLTVTHKSITSALDQRAVQKLTPLDPDEWLVKLA